MKTGQILIGVVCLLLAACTPTHLPKQQLVSWMEDPSNGLRKVREIGDFKFQLQYQPTHYMETKNPARKGGPEAVSEIKEPESTLAHFELRLGSKDRKTPLLRQGIYDPGAYQERVHYLSFEQEQRIYLISESDTLRPLLYHFERSYDLHADVVCSLAFEKLPKSDFSIMIDDANLGIGIINFSFQSPDFQAIPALKP